MFNFYYKQLILILILLFHKIFIINNYHEIIPNIYIGNAWSAFLNYQNFDVIVNVTNDIDFPKKYNKLKIRIPVDDNYIFKNQEIINYLYILEHLEKYYNNNKKILIHCRFGVQRSAFITQLLLKKILKFDDEECINLIKKKRKICFFPYHNFKHININQ